MYISVLCTLAFLRRTYNVISRNTKYGWIACSKISSIQQKYHQRSYCYIHFLISEYLLRDLQSTLARVNNKTVLILNNIIFSTFESIYLKSLQSGKKIEPRISNVMGLHVFRSEFGSYFSYFWLHTWLIFCFFFYVVNFYLIWRR